MATSTETFSAKYARAFLKALDKADATTLKKIQGELEALAILSKDPLSNFFASPIFNLDEKSAVLSDVFAQHKFQNETKQFAETLLSLNHLSMIGDIANDFAKELREKNQEAKIEVASAYPLSDEEQAKITATFEKAVGKKVLLDITVDRDLIGGVRAKVGGVVYDSSIQGHLLRLQKEFSL